MSVAHDAITTPVPDATTVRAVHDPIAQLPLVASPVLRAVTTLHRAMASVAPAVTRSVMVPRVAMASVVLVVTRAVMVLRVAKVATRGATATAARPAAGFRSVVDLDVNVPTVSQMTVRVTTTRLYRRMSDPTRCILLRATN